MNTAPEKKTIYEKEQAAYFRYVFGTLFDKLKGRPVWKQYKIINEALLTDPAAPKFRVYTPPGFEREGAIMMNGFRIVPKVIPNLNEAESTNMEGGRGRGRHGKRTSTRRRRSTRSTRRRN